PPRRDVVLGREPAERRADRDPRHGGRRDVVSELPAGGGRLRACRVRILTMPKAPAGVPILTIDGPSGAGKGTVARAVAARLGWHLLDSGALYRLTALAALRAGVPLDDAEAVARLAERLDVEFTERNGAERVILDGEDVTDALRTEQCGEAASKVAAQP